MRKSMLARIYLGTRLALSFDKIGGGSAKANPCKHEFAFCTRLALSFNLAAQYVEQLGGYALLSQLVVFKL